jgi:hypothetical protein
VNATSQSRLRAVQGTLCAMALMLIPLLSDPGLIVVDAGAAVRHPAEWPFATQSPWNYPIGTGALYEPVFVPRWDINNGGYANIEWYSIPTYVASLSDVEHAVFDRQKGPAPGALVATLRIPAAAAAARGSDGHMNLVDAGGEFVHELYHARRLPDGSFETSGYVKNDLRGPGAGFRSWHGTVAAGTSSLGGMIRRGELVAGTGGFGGGIRHVLQGVAPKDALNRNAPGSGPCPGPWCRPYVWPASSADSTAFSGVGYDTRGNVYMGSLLAIPPSVEIERLGITDPQALEIAHALQDYGIYIIDQGSTRGRLVIRIDPQAAEEIRNREQFMQGLGLAIRALMAVTNSHRHGRAPTTPGGGGRPRRPLAPPLP